MINLLISRGHNKVEKVGDKIHKTSLSNFEKLFDEYEWYRKAKENGIKTLSVSKIENGYSMDFVKGDNLGEVFWSKPIEVKKRIIDKYVGYMLANLDSNKKNNLMTELLFDKFKERVEVIKDSQKILILDEIAFYRENIKNIIGKVDKFSCIMHGDLFFGNTIVDSNFDLHFIDPRGLSGKWGIYGNSFYEIIKLAHSVHGRYDILIFGTSEVKDYQEINDFFFNSIKHNFGLSKKDILIGEMGLFISMLPIHSDDEERQLKIIDIIKKIYKELMWKN